MNPTEKIKQSTMRVAACELVETEERANLTLNFDRNDGNDVVEISSSGGNDVVEKSSSDE